MIVCSKEVLEVIDYPRTRRRPTFPHLKDAVLSAKGGLASGFGMEPGVSLSL
jgi:hypothetical protein